VLDHERRQAWRGPEDQEDLGDDTADDEDQAAQILKDLRDDDDLRVALVLQASPSQVEAVLATGERITLSGEGLRWAKSGLSPKAPDTLAVRRGSVIRVVKADKGGWAIAQWPQAQSAFVSLDPGTGRVRALVGGFDFTRQQFNHATQAWRQPGSSFKPFLYSAALEHGVQPATVVNDAPWPVGPDGWNPQNDNGQYDGPISLRRALAKSKNLVSIRLVQYIGVDTARQWAGRFGFDVNRQPDNLTLALGAGSTTPMQLATAYAALANGGYKVDPVVIERITDAQGQVVYQAPPPVPLTEAQRIIPARNAFVIDSLLNEVTRSGTAARAQATLKRPDIYGKTGTTNDAVDAWFAGFQPSVVAVVWMGYDDPRSLGSHESGGGASLPIWLGYMSQVLRNVPVHTVDPPEGVQEVNGEWYYNEYAEGGFVPQIGVDDAAGAASGASAAEGASAPPAPPPAPVASAASHP
jgi:penicillin-binding protein 1A